MLGVLCFDFFFVPPRYSFRVSDSEYIVTFLVMLAVSLVISGLGSRAVVPIWTRASLGLLSTSALIPKEHRP